MAVFDHISFDAHEQVVFCHDKPSGLKAIIAIHNTQLGPAFGGCRMWHYASDEDALNDVLRLSKGMTYKNSMAGLAMGGGKSVILTDPNQRIDRHQIFTAFGRFIDTLSGRYYAAEDVGTTPADISVAARQTQYVAGLEGKSGDPSPFTALGTYLGIKAAVKYKLGLDSLTGLRIAVQGLGHVGYYLCQYLHQDGAQLVVTDINQTSLARVEQELGAKIVAPDDIYRQDVDIYAPCALGATINNNTISQLKAGIIAGCANNQLATPQHGNDLKQLGILYAPDYVINAGGIINVSLENHYDASIATAKVEQIYQTLTTIFHVADSQNRATGEVADEMARAIIETSQKSQDA